MKRLPSVFLSLFLFSLCSLKAQQKHFVYVQTENRQPFYIKLDSKLYSSSAAGYLVVPALKEGTYNLAIGFPKNEWPEQSLACTIDQNDLGYLLKNFDDKGWGLVNLQNASLVMAAGKTKPADLEMVNKTDAFSNMLSNVVNDSTIRQAEVAQAEQKTASETATATGTEKNAVPGEAAINDARSVITRSLFNNSADGTEMVFIDESNGRRDTVTVFIPIDKTSAAKTEEVPKEEEKAKEQPSTVEAKNEEKAKEQPATVENKKEEKPATAKDTRFLEIEVPATTKLPGENKAVPSTVSETEKATPPQVESSTEEVVTKPAMINSDCKNFASGDDFLKLRKKMAASDTDDDMISFAKKMFKSRCFTVEQVKNLSVLFLKDAGKYAFFDMAYPFVSDSHNFGTLQNQLSDAYYISRFQVMIRH